MNNASDKRDRLKLNTMLLPVRAIIQEMGRE
jgi:hypothetical protein